MDGSRSNSRSSVPLFSGDDYPNWSAKMKQHLISKGVWVCLEKEKTTEVVTVSDAKSKLALSLIQHSLSPTVLRKISQANTPKQAWDTLHSLFFRNTSNSRESHQSSSKMSVKEELVKSYDGINAGEEWVLPLSGDKPFFDMVLMKAAVKPLCHMNFPMRVNSLLPSSNLVADVRFNGKIYEIHFYGKRKQKSLGSGWRQLVERYNLMEGEFVVFEVLESTHSLLKMNMQILKPTIPPELKQLICSREIQSHSSLVIHID
ncbi:hypothetical protein C2S51_011314 [Perilla frutescens var. frutescens]|nr:hypothetical protein C2S51_011314 [Perilla frutescens var. frutescens]